MESLSSLIFLMIINTWNTAKVLFLLVLDHLPGFYWYLNTYLDTPAGTWTPTWILLLVLEHLPGYYCWYLNTYLDTTAGTWTPTWMLLLVLEPNLSAWTKSWFSGICIVNRSSVLLVDTCTLYIVHLYVPFQQTF